MDSFDKLPDVQIKNNGEISKKFLAMNINSFKEACLYIHNLEYGYNSDYDDKMILFKENLGTCTTKHAVAASLAEELDIPLYKHIGVYKFTEEVSDGANEILCKYNIPYIPMVHCFLVFKDLKFDLTEGNNNGKKIPINKFIFDEKVEPFISRKDEYFLFKDVLKEIILMSDEMLHVDEKTLLKAREESIKLLKKNMK